jgi:DNA-binding transcriptional LysR family regulator
MTTVDGSVRSPQFDELRAFCAAVDLGGIGRAAQRLHLSQPAVSKRLKSLETLVGVALLERSAHGVTMTDAGERLYPRARHLVSEMEELTGQLDQVRGANTTVHLAISHTAAEFLMSSALLRMRRRTSAPVEVLIANSRVVKQMVRSGEADIGVAACLLDESVKGTVELPLMDDEIAIAVPLAHPWSRRSSIAPRELLDTPVVLRDPGAHSRQVIDSVLAEHDLAALSAASEVGSTQAAKDEAHELCAPTALSRLALSAADRLEIVTVDGLSFRRRFCILQPPGSTSSASAHLVEAFRHRVDAPESARN